MLFSSTINFDLFSPTGSIGIIVLIIGFLFTAMTFFVFYSVSNDVDSILDKKRKKKNQDLQAQKIAKLYPKPK